MDFTEIMLTVDVRYADTVSDIACMAARGGIYVEDYSHLEQEAHDIAHIDLIDEELLRKDRSKAIVHLYISPEDNPAEAVTYLRERLTAQHIPFEMDRAICRNEDWENNWKAFFKPMPIGERLFIRPVWVDDYDAQNRTVLHIEPGVSFGSGTHETTRLCLQAIEKHMDGCRSFLDVGCGSGILSVAALLLGAECAEAVDIDPLAVKMARLNGELNGFTAPQYTVLEGNLTDKVHGTYDIVAANIVADAILLLSKDIKQFLKPGALYITSGIIDLREQEILDAFDALGFEVLERYEEHGWLCFVTRES
ncbi:MAG: 50S ribosomal protein L11 methyltransferase [Clostridia bacterium]|nr:50S ribosomal protein L11 methyltransferase [Clostridia bacterium]